jgi:hypothetical protein
MNIYRHDDDELHADFQAMMRAAHAEYESAWTRLTDRQVVIDAHDLQLLVEICVQTDDASAGLYQAWRHAHDALLAVGGYDSGVWLPDYIDDARTYDMTGEQLEGHGIPADIWTREP